MMQSVLNRFPGTWDVEVQRILFESGILRQQRFPPHELCEPHETLPLGQEQIWVDCLKHRVLTEKGNTDTPFTTIR
jgi:hypothetical protein